MLKQTTRYFLPRGLTTVLPSLQALFAGIHSSPLAAGPSVDIGKDVVFTLHWKGLPSIACKYLMGDIEKIEVWYHPELPRLRQTALSRTDLHRNHRPFHTGTKVIGY